MLRFGITRFDQSNADWDDKAYLAERCGFDVLSIWTVNHDGSVTRIDLS